MTRHDHEDNTPDVADLLRLSADDGQPWQPDTATILRQGRRAVRRRRLAVTATAAGGSMVVAATAFAVPNLVSEDTGDGPDSSVASGSAELTEPPSAWHEVLEPLAEDEAIDRCQDQLATQHPDVPEDAWERPTMEDGHPVPDNEEFFIGDSASFQAGDIWGGCIVPGSWQPDPPVDLTQAAPAEDDHDAILRACSATINADLRQWNVAAAMADGVGGLAAMLTSPEDDPHLAGCSLQPSTWDAGWGPSVSFFGQLRLSEIYNQREAEEKDGAGGDLANFVAPEAVNSCTKTASTPCHGTMYSRQGVVSPDVASLKFELPDAQTVTVPVEGGLFAFRAVDGKEEVDVMPVVWMSSYNKDGELIERVKFP